MKLLGFVFYYLLSCTTSFIIPNELPTILSIIYSNIPPIKVGIDSRFGYGFRIGPHVDYQSLVEIGPQTNTNPISKNGTLTQRRSLTVDQRLQRLYKEALRSAKRKMDDSGDDKSDRTLVGNVEFKKVPGIDPVTRKNKPKDPKVREESSPTKFTLL